MESVSLKVSKDCVGMRLDQAIAAESELSRGKARKIIDLGGCYLNRKRIRRSSQPVKEADKIQIYWRDEELDRLKQISQLLQPQDIIFEDAHVLAMNKPAGLPAQGTRTQDRFHMEAQVQSLMQSTRGRAPALRMIHRLDRDTTGVMIFAKSKKAYQFYSEAFAQRKVEKEYHALCHGIPSEERWTQTEPLSKIHASAGRVYVDFDQGLTAETHFEVITRFEEDQLTLIRCRPITGRTHQIRAHLDYRNLPVVGDRNYGIDCFSSLRPTLQTFAKEQHMLHARGLCIPYLRGEASKKIVAIYPLAMASTLEELGVSTLKD
ncbi:RluA family pseudouridine synthase [Pseudobacteriovorax antillogorgiicola]|uniref:Pseudouridine synthase n=1 Tax=Pseudobacteriovorax antillogorgiicola TaxID=1513793 RepID=A0A1Y6BKG0_9BACT|nr:RluA family pseudouridine synthase [Pseudobacteriovorax antillogorgiicola]TCS55337.1 RluA family pseudouridine synthase [Pseudobacteriovorax antillogorgiicola]SMF14005.1 pseudouridine synthase, RluA family [Pseudobacteriovorax antillogorgiicola]